MDKLADSVSKIDMNKTVSIDEISQLLKMMQEQSISKTLSLPELMEHLNSLNLVSSTDTLNKTNTPITPVMKTDELNTVNSNTSPDFTFQSPQQKFTPFKSKKSKKASVNDLDKVSSNDAGPFSKTSQDFTAADSNLNSEFASTTFSFNTGKDISKTKKQHHARRGKTESITTGTLANFGSNPVPPTFVFGSNTNNTTINTASTAMPTSTDFNGGAFWGNASGLLNTSTFSTIRTTPGRGRDLRGSLEHVNHHENDEVRDAKQSRERLPFSAPESSILFTVGSTTKSDVNKNSSVGNKPANEVHNAFSGTFPSFSESIFPKTSRVEPVINTVKDSTGTHNFVFDGRDITQGIISGNTNATGNSVHNTALKTPVRGYTLGANNLLDDDDDEFDDDDVNFDDELPPYTPVFDTREGAHSKPTFVANNAENLNINVNNTNTPRYSLGRNILQEDFTTAATARSSRNNGVSADDDTLSHGSLFDDDDEAMDEGVDGDDFGANDNEGDESDNVHDSLGSLLFQFKRATPATATSNVNKGSFDKSIPSQSVAAADSLSSHISDVFQNFSLASDVPLFNIGTASTKSKKKVDAAGGVKSKANATTATSASSDSYAKASTQMFHTSNVNDDTLFNQHPQSEPSSAPTPPKDAPPGWWFNNANINISNNYASLDSDNDTEDDERKGGDNNGSAYDFSRGNPRPATGEKVKSPPPVAAAKPQVPSFLGGKTASLGSFPFAPPPQQVPPSSSTKTSRPLSAFANASNIGGFPVRPPSSSGSGGNGVGMSSSDASLTQLAEMYGSQGKDLYNAEQYDKALDSFQKCLNMAPASWANRSVVLGNRAAALVMLERYKEAVNDCDDALKLDSTLVKLHIRKGRCLMKLGHFNVADEAFSRVLEYHLRDLCSSDTSDTEQNKLRSQLESQKNEAKAALKDIDKLRVAVRNLIVLEGQQSYAETLITADQILEMSPYFRVAQISKATAMNELMKYEEVKRYCEDITFRTHSSIQIFYSHSSFIFPCPLLSALIWVMCKEGNNILVDVRSIVATILCMGPEMGVIYVTSLKNMDAVRTNCNEVMTKLSNILTELSTRLCEDDKKDVWMWVTEELKHIKDMINLKSTADQQFSASKDYKGAIYSYGCALKLDPSAKKYSSVVLSNRAACYVALGQYMEAVNDCHSSLVKDPGYARAVLRRARAYQSMKKYAESVRDYRRYLCSDPIPSDAQAVQKELDTYIEQTRIGQENTRKQYTASSGGGGGGNASYKPTFNANGSSSFYPNSSAKQQQPPGTSSKTAGNGNKFSAFFDDDDDDSTYSFKYVPNNNSKTPFGSKTTGGGTYSEQYRQQQQQQSQQDYFPGAKFHNSRFGGPSSQSKPGSGQGQRTQQQQQQQSRQSQYSSKQQSSSDSDDEVLQPKSKVTCHYAALGVHASATDRELTTAYRKLALKYHPDKNREPGAEDQFKTISYAYSVLQDKTTRRQYDLTRPVVSGRR